MSEATETSPLLVPDEAGAASTSSQEAVVAPEISFARDHFQRSTKILTKIIFVVAIVDFVFIIASAILAENGPFRNVPWNLQSSIRNIGFYLAFAFVLSIINLRYKFVVGLNMVADLFLSWSIGLLSIGTLVNSWPGSSMCKSYYWGPPPDGKRIELDPRPGCYGAVLALQILMGIFAGLGIIVALTHFILLVLRCIACFRVRAWTRPFRIPFPTGELSLSVSIKVLRQQPAPGATESVLSSDPAVQVTTS